MIGSSGLSGDTLIACHFPVLTVPAWQLPVQNLYASGRRPGRLCTAVLTRAASLPEQDTLKQESVLAAAAKHFSSSHGSLVEDRVEEEEGASDTSSSSPGDESCGGRGATRTHNSFLPSGELDEEDEDSEGDNLHRYHEDSSFVLHGNWPAGGDEGRYLMTRKDLGGEWGREGGTLLGCERRTRRKGMNKFTPEMFCNSLTEEASDCSSSSSDGVLVNFCTIYSHSSNPALPLDLQSPDGSVFLNLQPVPRPLTQEPHHDAPGVPPTPKEEQPWSSSYWSQDFNCNLSSLEPTAPCLTSLEVSDLAACLQGPTSVSLESQQKYYKLVTCDLSSQSPSPAWSSQASCPEGPSTNPFHPSPHRREGRLMETEMEKDDRHQSTEKLNSSSDLQSASTSTEKIHIVSIMPTYLDTSSTQQDQREEHGATPADTRCSSRPQRPSSLPIQPIVLTPPAKPAAPAQHLGGLLDQFMSQRDGSGRGSRSRAKSENMESSPGDAHWSIFLDAPSSSDTCSTCTPSPKSSTGTNTWSRESPRNQTSSSPKPGRSSKTNPFLNVVSPLDQIHRVKIPTYKTRDSSPDPPRLFNHPSVPYTPPTLPLTTHQPTPPSRPTTTSEPRLPGHHLGSGSGLSAALSSVVPLSSLTSLVSLAASGLHRHQNHQNDGESLIQSDKPPTEFCLSPETSYESMSISHLQRRGLLRSVSRAVDLIMAHFGSSRDFEEKMRLGNSSWSPTIGGLVLEHLCPALQNILEDGLRDHKLDLIIGQRRNHCWSIVEVSTKIGPSTKVLHSLVYKIRQYPQLTSSCMRLRAFIMGLLNLRALEFWLSHLLSLREVVTSHYHSWGFLSMSLGPCQPMFQELLLLLQPLSVLPFDLNLLLEPRLLQSQHLCSEDLGVSSPPPCSALLATSWPRLRCDRKMSGPSELLTSLPYDPKENRGQILSPIAEWWPQDVDVLEAKDEAEQWRKNNEDNWSQISMESRQGGSREGADGGSPRVSPRVPAEAAGGLRWAKLFGAADPSAKVEAVSQSQIRRCSRPSQWLDRSHLGLLAQSLLALRPRQDKTDIHDEC